MSWSDTYLAIPHRDLGRDRSGADCWGLLRLVYRDQLQIDLPSYDGAYATSAEVVEIAALIDGYPSWADWVRVEADPQPFDVALFRRGPWRSHVGVVVQGRQMLHMAETGSRIEDMGRPGWATRLTGVWRHHSRAGA